MKFKEKIMIFSLILFAVILTFSTSYQIHYATDSWSIMKIGLDEYSKVVFGNGRIIQYFILKFFNIFNLEFITLYRIFLTITALLISSSIYITYNFFNRKDENSKYINVILLLSSLNIFLTISLAEMCIFIECLTMSLSILLSIISSIFYTKKKYIISFILLIIATLSYQAGITLFSVYVLIKYFINNSEKKYSFKYILKILIFYFLDLAICFCILKVIKMSGTTIDRRVGNFGIYEIIYILKNMIINFGSIISVYTLIMIYFKNITKKNYLEILILTFTIVITTCALTFGTSSILSFRMMLSIFGNLGIFGIYVYSKIDIEKDKKYFLILQIVVLLLNIISFYVYIGINIRQTKQTQEIFVECRNIIKEYEENNNIQIKNISFYCDKKVDCNSIDIPADWPPYATFWSQEEFFELVIGREINIIKYDEDIYNKYFKEKNWKEFSKELLLFEGNTLHFSVY